MSWLSNAFGGNKNPADVAMPYLDKIPEEMRPYFQDYINRGKTASDTIGGEYDKGINDPNSIYNKLSQGYKESPGYQFKLKQALDAQGNASARGGMLGTPQDQQYAMDTAHGIADQDFEEYLKHMFGIYDKSMEGTSHTADQGFNASTDFGKRMADIMAQKAGLAYKGQAGENERVSNNWSNLFKGAGTVGGWALGNDWNTTPSRSYG